VILMRTPNWTPLIIVPNGQDHNLYLDVEDFGRKGTAYVGSRSLIWNPPSATAWRPVFPDIAFNIAEGWSHDASEDVAQELRRRCDLQFVDPRKCPSL
jgi:hypothetical protein